MEDAELGRVGTGGKWKMCVANLGLTAPGQGSGDNGLIRYHFEYSTAVLL